MNCLPVEVLEHRLLSGAAKHLSLTWCVLLIAPDSALDLTMRLVGRKEHDARIV